jgi:hypothetical protein
VQRFSDGSIVTGQNSPCPESQRLLSKNEKPQIRPTWRAADEDWKTTPAVTRFQLRHPRDTALQTRARVNWPVACHTPLPHGPAGTWEGVRTEARGKRGCQ